MSELKLKLTNYRGHTDFVDIADTPFRLNRNSFEPSQDRLKVLGGVTSTSISLKKSSRNNKLFFGKGNYYNENKFNNSDDYQAEFIKDGYQIAKGTFTFDGGGITSREYQGTFYGEDIDWIDKLSKIKLNEVGYVEGRPTWLVPFDGALTFNQVNDLSNNDTDFVCPTIVYNNTPRADYLDLTDTEVWGQFDLSDPFNPVRLTPAYSINDFECETGFFGTRLGLTFEAFPPAINYKNLISKVFNQIGVAIECPLFNEDWFNAIYLPYVGERYKYNWKNLAEASSNHNYRLQNGLMDADETNSIDTLSPPTLPILSNDPQAIYNWFNTPIDIIYRKTSLLKADDFNSPRYKNLINASNPFGIEGQYIAPVSGNYSIKVSSSFESSYNNFNKYFYGTGSNILGFDGRVLLENSSSNDINSSSNIPFDNKHYGCDDNVLVILRKNEKSESVFKNTENSLMEWLSGENKDFIINPSDVIGYISPKRYQLYLSGAITDYKEAFGSPLTNWDSDMTIEISNHQKASTPLSITSSSSTTISIDVDLKKNERVEIFWINLGNMFGTALFPSQYPSIGGVSPVPNLNSVAASGDQQDQGEEYHEIKYTCGEYDLDLVQNLPDINCKDFIASFLNQFNLFPTYKDGVLSLTPQKQYLSNQPKDITERVIADSWSSTPLPTARKWTIGYDTDAKDRLLATKEYSCGEEMTVVSDYANMTVLNESSNTTNEIKSLNLFSPTKFVEGEIVLHDVASPVGVNVPLSSPDPASGVIIQKGIEALGQFNLGNSTALQIPSIQSLESFNQVLLGDLTYDYSYTPRLFYHLGTVNQYANVSDSLQCLVGSPRGIEDYILKQQHWFRPTVSQFDYENELLTGISYPSLRYDQTVYDEGMYIRYFENLLELFNRSEYLSLEVSLRGSDWQDLDGSKMVVFKDALYRLSKVTDYDPQTNNPCKILLIKEI